MDKDNENPKAFPSEHKDDSGNRLVHYGMTLRDYFAAKAPEVPEWFSIDINDEDRKRKSNQEHHMMLLTAWRWHYADAMLKQRTKLK